MSVSETLPELHPTSPSTPPDTAASITVRPVRPADLPAITALQARAFGPGRFARTAYRIREGQPPISNFCLVAVDGSALIAAIRLTEITIGDHDGALLLGPLAVAPDYAGLGHGKRLVADSLARAQAAGNRLVVLVGNRSYYERFGFVVVPPGQIWLPGPADPARILAAELSPAALAAFRGEIRAA